MTQDELRTLYIAQRDKHLEQLMAINARSVFAVLALAVSILVGLDKIEILKIPQPDGTFSAVFFVIAFLLLTVAGALISLFHTKTIRSLETKICSVKDVTKEDFRIITPNDWKNPFRLTLAGVICVIVAILILLKHKFL